MNGTLERNRLDPSQFVGPDQELLDRLGDIIQRCELPSLVFSNSDEKIEIPKPLFRFIGNIIFALRQGKPIVLFPVTESLTTQAAADCLGVSRPFFVELLNDGKISHHKVGTHRRVYLKDVLQYMQERDRARHDGMDKLNDEIEKADLYEKIPPIDAPS